MTKENVIDNDYGDLSVKETTDELIAGYYADMASLLNAAFSHHTECNGLLAPEYAAAFAGAIAYGVEVWNNARMPGVTKALIEELQRYETEEVRLGWRNEMQENFKKEISQIASVVADTTLAYRAGQASGTLAKPNAEGKIPINFAPPGRAN